MALVFVTVMLTITAVAGVPEPTSGTPPRPATLKIKVLLARSGAIGTPPFPVRVSRIRSGVRPVNCPPVALASEPSVNHPPTSTTTSVFPAPLLMLTAPPVPSIAITRLGTVCPALKLRLDAPGTWVPAGNTVR